MADNPNYILRFDELSQEGYELGFPKGEGTPAHAELRSERGGFGQLATFEYKDKTIALKFFYGVSEETDNFAKAKENAKKEYDALNIAYRSCEGKHSPIPYGLGTITPFDGQNENNTVTQNVIVEKFVSGSNLKNIKKYLNEKGITNKYEQALRIGLSITEALSSITKYDTTLKSRVIYPHRDVKDANMRFCINSEDKEITCILLDWGQVHKGDFTEVTISTEHTHRQLTTPYIAAPEMLYIDNNDSNDIEQRKGRIGPSVDSWSVAAIMHYVATGKYPYQDEIREIFNDSSLSLNNKLSGIRKVKDPISLEVDSSAPYANELKKIICQATLRDPAPLNYLEEKKKNPNKKWRLPIPELYTSIKNALEPQETPGTNNAPVPIVTPSPTPAPPVPSQPKECAHSFGEALIKFAADGKSATASKTCKDCGHKVSEKCTVTSEIAKQPTCTEPGKTKYIAKSLGAVASKTIADIPALGHLYTEPKIEFASDGKSATASKTCRDCGHKVSEKCTVTSTIAKQPTCTEPGETEYRASGLGYYKKRTMTDIPAIGHLYTEPKIEFAADGKSATASKVCKNCGHKVSEKCTVTSEIAKQPTCTEPGETEPGETKYTAKGLGAVASKTIADIPWNDSYVGPNDACPCGSGKKFKYCCGEELYSQAKNSAKEQAKSKEKAAVAKTDASPKAAKIKKAASVISAVLLLLLTAWTIITGIWANYAYVKGMVDPETTFGEAWAETLAGSFEGINRWIGTDARITQEIENIASVQVGETVEFGVYEQDNNMLNGKEPISWRVLAVENGEALLISEKVLDCKHFTGSVANGFNYETSDLNTWLKGDFTNEVFSNEKEKNLLSTLPFCLSRNDANAYFFSDEDRICYPTAYAAANDTSLYSDYNNACDWVLSSTTPAIDDDGDFLAVEDFVYCDGKISCDYSAAIYPNVRPAIWVNVGAEQA